MIMSRFFLAAFTTWGTTLERTASRSPSSPKRTGQPSRNLSGSRDSRTTRWNIPLRALNLQESFRLDTRGLNDWPPFVDLGPLQRAERVRRLLLAGRNLLDDFGEPLTDLRTGQSSNNGGIEFGHNFLRRSFGYPKPLPDRNIKSRESRLVHR